MELLNCVAVAPLGVNEEPRVGQLASGSGFEARAGAILPGNAAGPTFHRKFADQVPL